MTPPGSATGPPAVGGLPGRDALLERTLPDRQKLYRLVRQMLDELDEAAPWEQLYYPPDGTEAFLGMAAGLIGVVDAIPARTRELVELLSLAAPDDETRQTLEDAEFYFAGIHNMCAHDLRRLRSLLRPHTAPGAPPLAPTDRNYLCEVAADLKGKYASALMGATASIVAEGSWSGVEVEPILFPEKVEEFRRNAELARGLQRALDAIGELRAQVPFPELLERWRGGARVDPYALADLATFRGVLGQLLKRSLRRALYSGDYHQIQRREAALATRVAELEALHHRTWSEPPEAHDVEVYRQMQRLTLEIAAILDAELLELLVGSSALKDLRQAAATDRAAVVEQTASGRRYEDWVRADRRLLGELESLVPLLGGDDLKAFLTLLLASVLKRASLNGQSRPAHPPAPAPPPATDELLPPVSVMEPDREVRDGAVEREPRARLAKRPRSRPESSPRVPVSARPEINLVPPPPLDAPPTLPEEAALAPPVEFPTAAPPPLSPAASEARRDTLDGLHRLLLSLQSADNSHWSSFRMLQRLLQRHARVPPSIVQGAHPFVWDVLNGLVPQLEAAASLGVVPQEARKRLVECCMALTDDDLSPEQMVDQVPAQLTRLHRLLEALTAATAAQLRALP